MKIVGPACVVAHGNILPRDLIESIADFLYIPPDDEWEVQSVKMALLTMKIDVYFISFDEFNRLSQASNASCDIVTNLQHISDYIHLNKIAPITL